MSIPARRVLADEERIDWLRLSRTAQVGPITFFALIARFGSAGAAIDELPGWQPAPAGRNRPPSRPRASSAVKSTTPYASAPATSRPASLIIQKRSQPSRMPRRSSPPAATCRCYSGHRSPSSAPATPR